MDPLLATSVVVIIIAIIVLRRYGASKISEAERMLNEVANHRMREMRIRAMQQTKKDGKDYYDLLFNDICPLCGEKVETERYGEVDQFSDHKCNKCGFATVGEVLV